MKGNRINDEERRLWVLNDYGLYTWWQDSRKGLYRFIRENRAEITRLIMKELNREPVS
jgi:hypothetical protein